MLRTLRTTGYRLWHLSGKAGAATAGNGAVRLRELTAATVEAASS